ncbi:unnamed protein product [Arabis nemorensis]|uniref:Cytochrome P450 n=1 Tax=Arabis nemorensis TaxID=586526 RepID=A0A565BYL5_9BRAS|nr:unnamed protein product [Arabis nemorensis]
MRDTIAPALFLVLSFLSTFLLLVTVKSRRRSTALPPPPPGLPGPITLPPGPPGWPLIGNLFHIIGKAPHRSLADLSRVYRPIMRLTLGSITTVVISLPEAAREVLRTLDHDFSARTFSETVRAIGHQDFMEEAIGDTAFLK